MTTDRTRSASWRKIAALSAAFAIAFAACSSTGATPSASSSSAPSTAPSGGGTGDKPLFVAINKAADQQYFIDLQTSFVSKIEELGGTAEKYDAKDQAELGVNLVNDAISKGAKGISITVPDQAIGPAIAKAAKDAGIPLIATDDPIEDDAGNPIPFVGFDGTDMGNKVGDEAGRLLKESGWLTDGSVVGMLAVEKQDLSVCELRTEAQKAKVQAAGLPADRIYDVASGATVDTANTASGPVITAHPDVTKWIVTGCNDESVLGAINALAAAGVAPANIIGVGLGAYEACRPWAAAQDSGFKAALFISGLDVGSAAAEVLYNAVVNGAEIPAMTVANTTIVTADTYKDVMDATSIANCGG
ncbi:MAG TPA: substrate-binding domain-containing protein [Candidatus Limnocylindrales bacterium]|nr:substrate-binding domain-containing protein [Candidatus Limnocylindrales bacterium]